MEQGRRAVARLAADAVLLSNLLYRMRMTRPDVADYAASSATLPRCIGTSHTRRELRGDCTCQHGLRTWSRSPCS